MEKRDSRKKGQQEEETAGRKNRGRKNEIWVY